MLGRRGGDPGGGGAAAGLLGVRDASPAQAAGTAIGLASPRSWRVPGARGDAGCPGWGPGVSGCRGRGSTQRPGGAPGRRGRRSRDGGWRGGRIAVGQPRACGRWYPRAVLIKAPRGGKERLKWGEGPGAAISGLDAAKATDGVLGAQFCLPIN